MSATDVLLMLIQTCANNPIASPRGSCAFTTDVKVPHENVMVPGFHKTKRIIVWNDQTIGSMNDEQDIRGNMMLDSTRDDGRLERRGRRRLATRQDDFERRAPHT